MHECEVEGRLLYNMGAKYYGKNIHGQRARAQEYYRQREARQRRALEKMRNGGRPLKRGRKKKDGCYVATCVYGSYDCPQVWTLRRYRDQKLALTVMGRAFIRCYYAVSPTVVKLFGKTKLFRNFWRKKLDRMVRRLNDEGFCADRYQD